MAGKRQRHQMQALRAYMLPPIIMGLLLLNGCSARAPKVYHVGVLYNTGSFVEISYGFKDKMTELGYVEGQNIHYDVQDGKDDPQKMQQIARQFVADRVDLILTLSTPTSLFAKEASQGTDVPVLFAYASIEDTNLVDSVQAPGGNITGVRYPGPEQISKRLEILLEIVPRVKNVWIGYDTNSPNTATALNAVRRSASFYGVKLLELPAVAINELEADLTARAESGDPGIDGIILMPDGFNHSPVGLPVLCNFAKRLHIPLGGSFFYTVEAGALFGNANSLTAVGEMAAPLADKIFKGIPAGTIPVVTPEHELWINYAIAQELGLSVPEGLLKLADGIIR
jgi:putative ABC transport system substrate-binding protein